MKLAIGGVVLAFLLGSCMGAATSTPEVDIVRIPGPTKYVEVEPDVPEPEPYVPEVCLEVGRIAQRIVRSAETIFNTSTEQLRILSLARRTLANGGDLNVVDNRQRNLKGRNMGALYTLEAQLAAYEGANQSCEEQTE